MRVPKRVKKHCYDRCEKAHHRSDWIITYPPPSTGTNYNLVDSVKHEPHEKVIWKIICSPDGHFVYYYRLKSGRRKRRKRCPGCENLLEPGQRKCLNCQSETRKARNRRYYEVLKTRFKTVSS
jgi:hypothetical protein